MIINFTREILSIILVTCVYRSRLSDALVYRPLLAREKFISTSFHGSVTLSTSIEPWIESSDCVFIISLKSIIVWKNEIKVWIYYVPLRHLPNEETLVISWSEAHYHSLCFSLMFLPLFFLVKERIYIIQIIKIEMFQRVTLKMIIMIGI